MADTRVLPSGKVYRQMFDAQVQLSLALYDSRRKRAADEGDGDGLLSGDAADSASQHLNGTYNTATTRNFLYSGGKRSEDQDDSEVVCGLPDIVVPDKKNSDIIDRLKEKRQKDHNEAVSQLQADLSSINLGIEPLFRHTGNDILLRLSEYNDNIERIMQNIENICDLTAHSYQDLHEIRNKVCCESSLKTKLIKQLDEIYSKYESERKAMISALLRKYTTKLEKICYLMPCDVHRLIDNEAMMINQALLANRRALAKLHLNLMEKHLQMDVFQRLKWEEKLQDWKRIKLNDAISQFKDFMNSPQVQNPKNIQDTLRTLKSEQKTLSEKRIQSLKVLRDMTPPRISKSSVTEWYLDLSVINEQIDRIHVATMETLHKMYDNNWQVCLAQVDLFRTEMSTCGFTLDEIQNFVNTDILPLIGPCQSQTKVYLEKLDKAFESLARTTADQSKCLFGLMCGAAQLWEIHYKGLLSREQQLQNSLEVISQVHYQENQRKEAQLDMMLDKLRQESSEEALKASLEKILTYLDEVRNGYAQTYKEEVETVECYPSTVLQELQAYSLSVSQFFSVEEVYGQDQDFCQIYPSLKLDQNIKTGKNVKHKDAPKSYFNKQESSNFDLSCATDDQHCTALAFSFSKTKETLITAKGNVYNCFEFHTTNDEEEEINLKETDLVLYPKTLTVEVLKEVRQTFFSNLEERFHIILTNTMTVVEAKKEKLKAEFDLRVQLHQTRAVRIEMDIHSVRAAELAHHRERVDQHCRGIQQVLENSQTDLQMLQVQLNKLTEDFQMQIYKREKDFIVGTSSEKLNRLWNSLQSSLDKLISVIQISQRDFRQKIEFRMEGLRESNVQIMRSFKLFSDGGNFTPQEIEVFHSQLEKMDKRIDTTEGVVIQDMEERESKCLDQAKDIFRRFGEKFSFHANDLKFLEKMQQIFTNTRVQIKSEALKSNMQKKMIDSMLRDLKQMTAEYYQPCPDKKIVTVVEITSLTTSLMEELKKRCQYLDCFLDPSMAAPRPETPLQGPFAVAARSRSRTQETTGSPDRDGLLHPSHIGSSFLDDAAVGVIKGLLKVGKVKDPKEENFDSAEQHASSARLNSPHGSGRRSGKSLSQSGIETVRRKSVESINIQSSVSVKRFPKLNRFDKKYLIFGSKPEEQKDIVCFKTSITGILWKANDILLMVAEEFYKKKKGPTTRPDQLQETFDQCAEEMHKRLLIYQSQAHDYHNSCLQEFQQQLKAIEEFLSSVPEILFSKLRDQYLEELTQSMIQIQHRFKLVQQQSEQNRREHSGQLRVRLSHPACESELKLLVEAEEQRQKQHRQAIQDTRQELQACVIKNAEESVPAFARLAEALLFQFDNLITIHEVQVGHAEQKENFTTLLRQTQTGLLQEDKSSAVIQKGSRTWPGICYIRFTDGSSVHKQSQGTVTITTAKTTLAHLKTIEVRDTMHELYGRKVQEELDRAHLECDAQEKELQQWHEHWQSQLKSLASLNSE
ncbi:coiled-coil domain-containing protein 180 [Danio aesculapii]|uniref:coiled-coil domain-containing protein 180 n=1 Tax=Danio aesculapii TaxID=1142201 RepID=UPI0024BFF5AF|nr:coiled-coil domain-containing protein 180 [Danio aesculapii]